MIWHRTVFPLNGQQPDGDDSKLSRRDRAVLPTGGHRAGLPTCGEIGWPGPQQEVRNRRTVSSMPLAGAPYWLSANRGPVLGVGVGWS